jgi:hypothetical protein
VREIWVAGFPSFLGGADTELDHLIDLLRGRDVAVTLVPMFGANPAMRESVLARGCRVEAYRPDVFAGRIVISFCNGRFLERLPEIAAAGRPRKVIWFNCMTYLFEAEKTAHARGLIDAFGFVSAYQRSLLAPRLLAIAPFAEIDYRPYFNPRRVAWRYRPLTDTYRIGRISRDDANKFAPDTWRIFDRVLAPPHLRKKVYILGHGPKAAAKIGPPPHGLDWMTWSGGAIPASTFYDIVDTMIHKTGGSRESYCRVLVEAYAYGVVPIVEADFAFPELVVHGETGFMTSDSDEMSYWASYLAMNPIAHRQMAINGRHHLERGIVDEALSWRGWSALLDAA